MSPPETMSPEMAAKMEQWAKFAQPGEGHKHFARLAGKWSAAVKFWFTPDAPPSESVGSAEFRLIFGGRFLVQEFKGRAMGQPFEGQGLTGFDNFRQEYISTWIDSMGTCLMITRGTAGADGNTIDYRGTHDDPATGRKDVPMRSVARFEGDDTHIVEMYCTDPSGKEFQNMEIVYKRQN